MELKDTKRGPVLCWTGMDNKPGAALVEEITAVWDAGDQFLIGAAPEVAPGQPLPGPPATAPAVGVALRGGDVCQFYAQGDFELVFGGS